MIHDCRLTAQWHAGGFAGAFWDHRQVLQDLGHRMDRRVLLHESVYPYMKVREVELILDLLETPPAEAGTLGSHFL